ncbi:hypothetical protein VCR6J2_200228 [Vibrio coralliirubri]|nr:hypothetical protein VCR6J2_200228 [Vibrio coralliirubri]CDU02023.1 hypothetical protein VCR8J2_850007 [Vibrio coralliirubri]
MVTRVTSDSMGLFADICMGHGSIDASWCFTSDENDSEHSDEVTKGCALVCFYGIPQLS